MSAIFFAIFGAIFVLLSFRFGKKDFLLVCSGSWIGGILGYSVGNQEIFLSTINCIAFFIFLTIGSAICYLVGSVLYFGIIGIYKKIKDGN